jgi:hypothetical protein
MSLLSTLGYAWPDGWGDKPALANDPERFGKNATPGCFISSR